MLNLLLSNRYFFGGNKHLKHLQHKTMIMKLTVSEMDAMRARTSSRWYWYHGSSSEGGLRNWAPLFLITYSIHQTARAWGDSAESTNMRLALSILAIMSGSLAALLMAATRSLVFSVGQSSVTA